MIVVDTNIITYFVIEGPFFLLARAAAEKEEWCAPVLWRSEFRSVLATYIRRGGMPMEEAKKLMRVAELHLWGREFTVQSPSVLDMIQNSKRSAYGCEFVCLAEGLGLRLLTNDSGLVSEFPRIAVHLRDYIQLDNLSS